MCTLTLLPLGGPPGPRLRVAFNRDESRQRAAALPPEVRECGPRRAIMPIDPVGGGTWIGVNDAGLAAALLNQNRLGKFGRLPPKGTRTRGEIVPLVLECSTIEAALDRLPHRVRLETDYAPFSLVLTDGRSFAEYKTQGGLDGAASGWLLERPRMFTSSGLGDALVHTPRLRLFDEMFAAPADPVAAQDAFHRHQWPDHPELSVCMERAEARTVSYTLLELGDEDATLTYFPAPPNEPTVPIRRSLRLERAA